MRHKALLAVIVITLPLATGWYFLRSHTIHVEQPIEFNHYKHHVELEMECEFCHPYLPDHSVAGLPDTDICATCHDEGVASDNPKFVQVAKIVKAHVESNQPISWNRMYESPGHVIFSHARHLSAHVECSECHGVTGTGTIPLAEPYRISMESCMECHRQRRVSTDCLTCHK